MTKNITLGTLKIPVPEFASQGNAILGIRDSGKTYTATYLAERLMDAGIPIVVFDPIGVWKYLRVPDRGKGYPVVVAGGENADLPLTPASAPEIVRAAMRENIPLVIDLFSMELSKADWKRIVEVCVRILLYENKKYGLRHIFIEEAAEFAPQRIGPDQGKVYAEIEKLARMGGNAQLGYTLINQRAEEVNKAVLELCDCLFLHRQKGRNSLTALGKWLDIGSVGDSKPIMESLPLLKQGDCWVWTAGSNVPVRVQIPQKNTFHPDRRALVGAKGIIKDFKGLDVTNFVQQLSGSLAKHLEEAKQTDPAELRKQIAQLQRELAGKQKSAPPEKVIERVEVPVVDEVLFSQLRSWADDLRKDGEGLIRIAAYVADLEKTARQKASATRPITVAVKPPVQAVARSAPAAIRSLDEPDQPLSPGELKTLIACAQYPSGLQREQLSTLTGYTRSSRNTFISRLSRRGAVKVHNKKIEITQFGFAMLPPDFEPLPTGKALREYWEKSLPPGESKLLQVLVQNYPDDVERSALDELIGATRSSRNTYISRLRARELVEITSSGAVKASHNLFD